MRKVILTLTVVLAFNLSNAQKVYEKYSLGNMSVVVEGTTKGEMYLDIDDVGVIMTSKDRVRFLLFLNECSNKFTKWAKVAKDNNVKELVKDINTLSLDGYFRYASEWRFGTANLRARISIVDGEAKWYIYIPKIIDDLNEYIDSEASLFFVTPTILREFNLYLDEERINSFISSENKQEDLFK